ncbi:Mitochondrial/chloroplast ribosomal protein L54/L37 [Phaffia rhodozyma]|uniref:Large ribosomal subunit protein mL54 n=1 Tax=Phaffia rhodozyma TaxID=264483 RepID=A0A0F7SXR9_PHARH|nr:Mitochondrial/chloroplast ribosomal protein L54/L37 [Phaffia rhodozyma]
MSLNLSRLIPAIRRTPLCLLNPSISIPGSFLVRRSQSTTTTSSPSTSESSTPSSSTSEQQTYRPVSSTPAGTPMPEVVVFKTQAVPVALPDEEYPSWLWTMVGEGKALAAAGKIPHGRGQEWEANEQRRAIRKANRAAIRTKNLLKSA